MAKGIFIGLSESDILEIRDAAVASLKAGRVTMSYSPGDGSSVSKQFAMPPAEVLAECKMALQQLNPETYGTRVSALRTDYRRTDQI